MAKTLANLRTTTRTYLDEVSEADWEDTEVDFAINDGYHEVVTATMETYEEFYVVTTSFNSVANQQEYGTADSFPSGFFKMRRVEINYDTTDANSIPRRAIPVSIDSVLRDLGNSALGITVYRNPAYYLIGSSTGSSGVKLGFIPEPTRAGTNAISIWYVPVQADLTAAGDAPNIPYVDRYYKLISLYAAATLLRKGQQEEDVALNYMKEFNFGLAKMQQQLEDRVADSGKSIVDTAGMDNDFDSSYGTF